MRVGMSWSPVLPDWHDSRMIVGLPPGAPGWRRTWCLGCERQLVAHRDPHVIFIGTRDGSALFIIEAEPQRIFTTSEQLPIGAPLYVLGAAHRDCSQRARWRLETGAVRLPDQLPLAVLESHDGELARLDLPPAVGRCPFCEATEDLTEEDVWARWISKLLRKHLGNFRLRTESGHRGYQRVPWVAPICGSCNNRWLSVLEKDVQRILSPMILGPQPGEPLRLPLTANEQELLATWAVKTALMIDFCGKNAPVVPAYYYQQLRMYRKALPNMVVLAAAYNGKQHVAFGAHGSLHLNITPSQPPNAFMTLFTVYRVIFKVFGYIGTEVPQNVMYDSAFDHGVSRIWPATGHSIEWPRNGLAFNDDALMPFAKEQPTLQGRAA
jgi:hypothetical protein